MVALALDLSTTTPSIGGGLPVKPDGWYDGMIVDTKSKNARDNPKNTYLECTIAYQDGSLFIERFNLWNENQDTVRIAKENLAAVCQAMGLGPQLQDSTMLHNRPFPHYLATEKSTTDKGNTITQNRMKAVRLPDGKVIGNVPPTPAAAPPASPPGPGFSAPAAPPAAPAAPAAPQAGAQPWGGGAPAAPPAGAPQAAPAAPAAPGFGAAPPAPPAAPGFGAPPAAPGFGAAPPAPPAAPGFGAPPAAPGFGAAPAPAAPPAFGGGGAAPWGGPQQ